MDELYLAANFSLRRYYSKRNVQLSESVMLFPSSVNMALAKFKVEQQERQKQKGDVFISLLNPPSLFKYFSVTQLPLSGRVTESG